MIEILGQLFIYFLNSVDVQANCLLERLWFLTQKTLRMSLYFC